MPEIPKFSPDELLRLYLTAESAAECASALDLLVEKYAIPVIERVLQAKFGAAAKNGFRLSAADFEDLRGDSCLKLIEKLNALRNLSGANGIFDFESYTAAVAVNVWNGFLNGFSPNRQSLKNKIRYALGKNRQFETWRDGGVNYCGLIIFEQCLGQVSVDELIARTTDECADFRKMDLPELLGEVLQKANSAVSLNEIVSVVARLWAIEDLPDLSLEGFREETSTAKNVRQNDFEMRFELARIWAEICELPVRQRTALLYNLRDSQGREMLLMFFNARIASLKQIADAMNLTVEECVEILPRLPFDDRTIAEKMNLTEKQVGNLRKAARDNLRRRLAGKPKRRAPDKQNEAINDEDFDGVLSDVLS